VPLSTSAGITAPEGGTGGQRPGARTLPSACGDRRKPRNRELPPRYRYHHTLRDDVQSGRHVESMYSSADTYTHCIHLFCNLLRRWTSNPVGTYSAGDRVHPKQNPGRYLQSTLSRRDICLFATRVTQGPLRHRLFTVPYGLCSTFALQAEATSGADRTGGAKRRMYTAREGKEELYEGRMVGKVETSAV
jgi:hypothetical protein